MNVIVTAGPSYEPIDEVRRLTNFSTGELGVLLANRFASAGFSVDCLRGVAATHPAPLAGPRHLPFTTNDDLLRQLGVVSKEKQVDAVFHAAALCDFKVQEVQAASGAIAVSAKIESRAGELILRLVPAAKVIGKLRDLFPRAALVGWKYELNGSREDALGRARCQLVENRTDACVLNGRAWGNGFAFCTGDGGVHELADKPALAAFLVQWLKGR